MSPDDPFFRISTNGLGGICHIDLPHDSALIDTFQCTSTATSSFKLAHIKPAMKALSCANKVCLRTSSAGILNFQYMIKTENGHTCYMEYYVRFFITKCNNQRALNSLIIPQHAFSLFIQQSVNMILYTWYTIKISYLSFTDISINRYGRLNSDIHTLMITVICPDAYLCVKFSITND